MKEANTLKNENNKFVIYYRVSTKGQGESGLGLEAQKRDVSLYLKNYSATPFEIVKEVTEIRTGKGMLNDRPELSEAVSYAEKTGAILLVAKLDRLGRDVELIAHLIKRIDIKVACMPFGDKFQLHLYAALAEQEREFISKRTKAALQAAKEKGVILGGGINAINASKLARSQKANEFAFNLKPVVEPLYTAGIPLSKIAKQLNSVGYITPRGKQFTPTQVLAVVKRLGIHSPVSTDM